MPGYDMGIFFDKTPYAIGFHQMIQGGKNYEIIISNLWYDALFNITHSQKGLSYLDAKKEGAALKAPSFFYPVLEGGKILNRKYYSEHLCRWFHLSVYPIEKDTFVLVAVESGFNVVPGLEALFHQNNDGVYFLDLNGHHLDANERAAEMLGYTRQELLELSIREISGEIDKSFQTLDKLFKYKKLPVFERVFLKKDGSPLTVEINLELVCDEEGRPEYIQSIVRDVSERKKYLQQLQKTKSIQKMILHLSQQLLQTTSEDYDKLIMDILSSLKNFLKVDRCYWLCFNEAQTTLSFYKESCTDPKKSVVGTINRDHHLWAIEGWGARTLNNQWIAYEKIPTLKTCQSLLTIPICSEKVMGVLCFDTLERIRKWNLWEIEYLKIVSNMLGDAKKRHIAETSMREVAEKAEKASKAKTHFLANMSHEIRTPLNGVLGFLDLLTDTELTLEQKKFIQSCKESGLALKSIVDDILDLSKIEAGKMVMRTQAHDFRMFIDRIVHAFKYQTLKKNIPLSLHLDSRIPEYLYFDSTRLKQVLYNLISNAFKFTERGYVELKITLVNQSYPSMRIKFSVKDTGIGMEKEDLKEIFKAFAQTDVVEEKAIGGTGLGLTISDQLVRKMGGQIHVKSQKNKGSHFYFTLPLKEAYKVSPNLKTLAPQKKKGVERMIKILIAEDVETNALLLQSILKNAYPLAELEWVETGRQAVLKVQKTDYDIVLMDVQMPDLDGVEATKIIRKENKKLPILALSAGVLQEEKEKCIQSGMTHFIEKPIDRTILIQMIEDILNRLGE